MKSFFAPYTLLGLSLLFVTVFSACGDDAAVMMPGDDCPRPPNDEVEKPQQAKDPRF